MKELKPEDVIKALEHCADYKSTDVSCLECPIYGKCFDEPNLLERAALALLREKDAEIERLRKQQESVATICNRAMEHYDALYEQAKEILKAETQAETLTEFKKRLVEKTQLIPTVFNAHFLRLVSQVISEMKGAKDGTVSKIED